ncbi:helix-turn-helix transcriptional regulator [Pseudovibrio ascidiaceicola]|uniref:helix-turn-helix transcriptional regulator n=1 Tax=Pseudovibrio ascidiaceicola TaxID=285279 RepID=UPI003D359DD6
MTDCEDLIGRMYSSVVLGQDLGQVFAGLAASHPDVLIGVQVQCYLNNDYYYMSFQNAAEDMVADMNEAGACNPFPPLAAIAPFQSVLYSERYIPPDLVKRSEFYERVLAKQNTFDRSRGFLMHRQGGDAAIVAFTMPDDFVGKDDQILCDTLERIRPHFQRAFSLALELRQREQWVPSDSHWLERVPSAAMILDRGLHVSAANVEAERLFQSSNLIHVDCRGELSVRSHNQRKLLEQTASRVRLGKMPIGPLALQSEQMRGALFAMTPIRGLQRSPVYLDCFVPADDAVLAIVIDPSVVSVAPVNYLQECMDVTKREAELIQNLVVGLSMRETADKMHISYNTARNHMARITEKAGFGSQSELVRIASDLAARVPSSLS